MLTHPRSRGELGGATGPLSGGSRSIHFETEYDLDSDDYEEESIFKETDCQLCEYFEPEDCPFLKNPSLLLDIQSLFDLSRKKRSRGYQRYIDHRQKLVDAIHSELRNHGRPLHYTVLTEMVRQRYPGVKITAPRILRLMTHRPLLFKKVDEGVYISINL